MRIPTLLQLLGEYALRTGNGVRKLMHSRGGAVQTNELSGYASALSSPRSSLPSPRSSLPSAAPSPQPSPRGHQPTRGTLPSPRGQRVQLPSRAITGDTDPLQDGTSVGGASGPGGSYKSVLLELNELRCARARSRHSLSRNEPFSLTFTPSAPLHVRVPPSPTCREGQHFGELALIDPEAKGLHTASVIAHQESEVTVLILSRQDFFRATIGDMQEAGFIEALQRYAKRFYPSAAGVREQIREQRAWERHKCGVVNEAHLSLVGPPSPRT